MLILSCVADPDDFCPDPAPIFQIVQILMLPIINFKQSVLNKKFWIQQWPFKHFNQLRDYVYSFLCNNKNKVANIFNLGSRTGSGPTAPDPTKKRSGSAELIIAKDPVPKSGSSTLLIFYLSSIWWELSTSFISQLLYFLQYRYICKLDGSNFASLSSLGSYTFEFTFYAPFYTVKYFSW
jgi:hypothetical protein